MRTLVIIALAFGLSACGPSLAQMALTRVDTTRANAQQRQGPRQAQAYAEAVHDAYRQGAYGQDVARLAAEVNEAAAVIDRAAANGGPDAPTLVAWKALLLVDAGQSDEGFAEFQRSMAIGPNSMAAKNLVLVYGMANQPHKVGAICVRTVPVVNQPLQRRSALRGELRVVVPGRARALRGRGQDAPRRVSGGYAFLRPPKKVGRRWRRPRSFSPKAAGAAASGRSSATGVRAETSSVR